MQSLFHKVQILPRYFILTSENDNLKQTYQLCAQSGVSALLHLVGETGAGCQWVGCGLILISNINRINLMILHFHLLIWTHNSKARTNFDIFIGVIFHDGVIFVMKVKLFTF